MPLGYWTSRSSILSMSVPHAGKRPDHAIEVLAALANRRSVLDDVANGPFATGMRSGVFRHQAVEQVVDVRKLVAGADLQPGHRDVSGRPAVELDGRAVLGVLDLEFPVQLGAGAAADDPETTPGGGDFGIGTRDPADEIGRPSVNGASLGITAMVEVDRSNAGIRKRKPDAVGVSAGHGLHGTGEAVPGLWIIRARQPRGIVGTVGRLGPLAVLARPSATPPNEAVRSAAAARLESWRHRL